MTDCRVPPKLTLPLRIQGMDVGKKVRCERKQVNNYEAFAADSGLAIARIGAMPGDKTGPPQPARHIDARAGSIRRSFPSKRVRSRGVDRRQADRRRGATHELDVSVVGRGRGSKSVHAARLPFRSSSPRRGGEVSREARRRTSSPRSCPSKSRRASIGSASSTSIRCASNNLRSRATRDKTAPHPAPLTSASVGCASACSKSRRSVSDLTLCRR